MGVFVVGGFYVSYDSAAFCYSRGFGLAVVVVVVVSFYCFGEVVFVGQPVDGGYEGVLVVSVVCSAVEEVAFDGVFDHSADSFSAVGVLGVGVVEAVVFLDAGVEGDAASLGEGEAGYCGVFLGYAAEEVFGECF